MLRRLSICLGCDAAWPLTCCLLYTVKFMSRAPNVHTMQRLQMLARDSLEVKEVAG